MSTKIRNRTSDRQRIRFRRKRKIRGSLRGDAARPRMAVFRSNKHFYVQVIDDEKMHTIASASTNEAEIRSSGKTKKNVDAAKLVGQLIAKRAMAKSITKVCFDRSGYVYHGRIRALADAAREVGLKF